MTDIGGSTAIFFKYTMKHLKQLFTALLLLCATVATAHDFEVGGIYYNITSAANRTVTVTYKGSSSNEYSNEYTGNVTIPESVTYNGTTYSVTSIGDYAFSYCSSLTSVVIGNSVTSIGTSAFEGCANIESLYISTSLESIGAKAFAGCEKIKEIKVGLEKPIRCVANIFADAVYDNAVLYVPTGTKSLYEEREPWNLFFDIVEMDFTGIDEVLDEVKGEPTVDASQNGKVEGVYYDLSGRAIESPTTGVYIVNGKKVVIK